MKLEVGMYVRTKNGSIDKIIDTTEEWYELEGDEDEKPYKIYKLNHYYYDDEFDEDTKWFLERFFVKASHNIIDILEVGDYVNGYYVTTGSKSGGCSLGSIYIAEIDGLGLHKKLYEKDIKSIVTKEQFEVMQYKVGE
ncbi:MAG: hypothetical protein IJB83_02600 [Bacilli bacterium]|nr:hypothetical protein [Bacilli bacterium]